MSTVVDPTLDLGGWAPVLVTTEEYVDPAPVAAVQALLDDGLPKVGTGDSLPPLWHWLAIPRWTPTAQLAMDGHPLKGSFLPPVPQPRRMWAGGDVKLHRPLIVGTTAVRESEVVSVQRKCGHSGELVIVKTMTRLYDTAGALAVEERQDVVYRDGGVAAEHGAAEGVVPATSEQRPRTPLRRQGEWEWRLATDPTLLMRFSSATANAHRIHYDWPYATQVEGYPGLLVHGPLMTLSVAETVRLERPDDRVLRIAHRNLSPLFCGQSADVRPVEKSATGMTLGLFASERQCTSLAVTFGS